MLAERAEEEAVDGRSGGFGIAAACVAAIAAVTASTAATLAVTAKEHRKRRANKVRARQHVMEEIYEMEEEEFRVAYSLTKDRFAWLLDQIYPSTPSTLSSLCLACPMSFLLVSFLMCMFFKCLS